MRIKNHANVIVCVNLLGWGGGIRLTSGEPANQANNHSSSVTPPCRLPLAIFTPNAYSRTQAPNPRHVKTGRKARTLRGWSGGIKG